MDNDAAHYPKLEVLVASEGQSRLDIFNEGKKVDTIHIYKYDIQQVRKLLQELGLERDESITWETKRMEAKMAKAFMDPP